MSPCSCPVSHQNWSPLSSRMFQPLLKSEIRLAMLGRQHRETDAVAGQAPNRHNHVSGRQLRSAPVRRCWLALQLVGVAAGPLNVTVLAPWLAPKLVPAIVTDVPTAPEVGEKLVMLGVGNTVKLTPLLATPETVTTTFPVAAPVGTGTVMSWLPSLSELRRSIERHRAGALALLRSWSPLS